MTYEEYQKSIDESIARELGLERYNFTDLTIRQGIVEAYRAYIGAVYLRQHPEDIGYAVVKAFSGLDLTSEEKEELFNIIYSDTW